MNNLQKELKQITWFQEQRHWALEDEFQETYKGWEIRLNAPNGGITSASIIPAGEAPAWTFVSSHLW